MKKPTLKINLVFNSKDEDVKKAPARLGKTFTLGEADMRDACVAILRDELRKGTTDEDFFYYLSCYTINFSRADCMGLATPEEADALHKRYGNNVPWSICIYSYDEDAGETDYSTTLMKFVIHL